MPCFMPRFMTRSGGGCACILGATSIGLLALSWYQGEYEEEFPEHLGDHDPLLPGGERDLPSKA